MFLIRPAFIRLVQRKVHITLSVLHTPELKTVGWPYSRTTLWRVMKTIGFEFSSQQEQSSYYNRMRDNDTNIALRGIYLTKLQEYKALL